MCQIADSSSSKCSSICFKRTLQFEIQRWAIQGCTLGVRRRVTEATLNSEDPAHFFPLSREFFWSLLSHQKSMCLQKYSLCPLCPWISTQHRQPRNNFFSFFLGNWMIESWEKKRSAGIKGNVGVMAPQLTRLPLFCAHLLLARIDLSLLGSDVSPNALNAIPWSHCSHWERLSKYCHHRYCYRYLLCICLFVVLASITTCSKHSVSRGRINLAMAYKPPTI